MDKAEESRRYRCIGCQFENGCTAEMSAKCEGEDRCIGDCDNWEFDDDCWGDECSSEHNPDECGCQYVGNDMWTCGHIDNSDSM